jgi:hypothetical protein
MLTITDTSTRSYVTVNEALSSAERLAAECDRRQVFDLQAIRRQHAPSAKKGKKRPRSVGAWEWASERKELGGGTEGGGGIE